MTFFAILGILLVTAVLGYATLVFLLGFYAQHVMAGLDVLSKKELALVIVVGAVLVFLWFLWWTHIGTHIDISIGVK